MDANAITLSTRNASLVDMVSLLQTQHEAKLDVVAPSRELVARGGELLVQGAATSLSLDGVTRSDAVLRPTSTADAGIAEKLGIPTAYIRRLRAENVGLYDDNVNGWLTQDPDRRFLVRALADDQGRGVMRAMLSDQFRIVDNLDVLLTCLEGIREAGAPVEVTSADLSESKMYVKVRSTAVAAMAPALLRNYVSPFSGARGADNPTVFAGFVISNSETGQGKFKLTPQITVEICDNGMTLTKHALSEIHVGGKLDKGVIRWAQDTQTAALELVRKQARDAVASFLDERFVAARIAEIEADAGVRIRHPQQTLEHVGKALRFSTRAQESILDHFIRGGDTTSGGVLHAVTSAAQTLDDADAAHDLERAGLRAMALAAAHAA